MRVKRAVGGFYVSGCHLFLTVKWLRPRLRALRGGIRQWQVGRLLVRLSPTLRACSCGRSAVPEHVDGAAPQA